MRLLWKLGFILDHTRYLEDLTIIYVHIFNYI